MSNAAEQLLALRPKGGFRLGYADPAWQYATRGKQGASSRLPDRHYKTMPTADICALPVSQIMADDAWLFIWSPWAFLEQVLRVIKAWDFEFSSIGFTWVKLRRGHTGELMTRRSVHMTTGYTTRKNTEPCWIARRGSPKRNHADIQEVVFAPIREHSRKPDEVARRIVRYGSGPRVELFARQAQPGFVGWGDELGKFGAGS